MKHLIGKQVLDIRVGHSNDSFRISNQLSKLYWASIVPILEELFNRFADQGEVIRIDRLEIDLGRLTEEQLLDGKFLEILKQLLEVELSRLIVRSEGETRKLPVEQSYFEKWMFFLERGYLRWETTQPGTDWHRAVLDNLGKSAVAVEQLRQLIRRERAVSERIVLQHPPPFLKALVELYTGKKQDTLIQVSEEFRRLEEKGQLPVPSTQLVQWNARKMELYFWQKSLEQVILNLEKPTSNQLIQSFFEALLPKQQLASLVLQLEQSDFPVLLTALQKASGAAEAQPDTPSILAPGNLAEVPTAEEEKWKEADTTLPPEAQKTADTPPEAEKQMKTKREESAEERPPDRKERRGQESPPDETPRSRITEAEAPGTVPSDTEPDEDTEAERIKKGPESQDVQQKKGRGLVPEEERETEKEQPGLTAGEEEAAAASPELEETVSEKKKKSAPKEKAEGQEPVHGQEVPSSETQEGVTEVPGPEEAGPARLTEDSVSKTDSEAGEKQEPQPTQKKKQSTPEAEELSRKDKKAIQETIQPVSDTTSAEREPEAPGHEEKPVELGKEREERVQAKKAERKDAEAEEIARRDKKAVEETTQPLSKESEAEKEPETAGQPADPTAEVDSKAREKEESQPERKKKQSPPEAEEASGQDKKAVKEPPQSLSKATGAEQEPEAPGRREKPVEPVKEKEDVKEVKKKEAEGKALPASEQPTEDDTAEAEAPRLPKEEADSRGPEVEGPAAEEPAESDRAKGKEAPDSGEALTTKPPSAEEPEKPAERKEPVSELPEPVEPDVQEGAAVPADELSAEAGMEDSETVPPPAELPEQPPLPSYLKEEQAPLFPEVSIGEALYVGNAGLVIVYPFFTRFLDKLGLLENNDFKSQAARHRAIHLLQYLAVGASDHLEYSLVLPKLMCGVPVNMPIDHAIEITDSEREEGEGLLEVIIEHWGVLKKTSPDGLREGFLQREGKLAYLDSGWKLNVEQKPMDILLDKLPWGFSIIKFPWMAEMLEVEWR